MELIVAAALLGICEIIGFVGFGWLIRQWFESKQAEIERRLADTMQEWLVQPAPDKPSKLAELADAAGTVIGSAAARSIMATVSQSQSAIAHVANGAADQLQGQTNPILGLLQGGKRGKGAAVLRLAQMLGPMLGGLGGGKSGSNGGTEKPPRMNMEM